MPNIFKRLKYKNSVDHLVRRFPSLEFIKDVFIFPHEKIAWHDDDNGGTIYDLQIVFIGKTGYGKSTTVNKIVGQTIFESNDISACTRHSQCAHFYIGDSNNVLSLTDLPGTGESISLDSEYIQLYSKYLTNSSVIVYVMRADQRDFSIDEKTFKQLFQAEEQRRKVIVALNCVDKIEPVNRSIPFHPSKEQRKNMDNKIKSISQLFNISSNYIVPYSAIEEWNLDSLMASIAEVLKKSENITLPFLQTEEGKRLRDELRMLGI